LNLLGIDLPSKYNMNSLPTYNEDGVTYDLPNLLNTLRHDSDFPAIKVWIQSVIDSRFQEIPILVPIPNELLSAKWTLDHIVRLIDLATVEQVPFLRALIQ